jgi:hypothetical protein
MEVIWLAGPTWISQGAGNELMNKTQQYVTVGHAVEPR